jgi:unconventional prefoldin RPB5 interactor 1
MELTEIERQRRALEENVQKLRQSLKHWQTWEAEYEGLKEELIATGPEELTAKAVSEICKTYGGALVTEKEILELAGQAAADSNSPPRRRGQILGQISRRQEYVQRNIDTISKQFFVAEGKLEEFAFASVTASGVYGDGIGEDDDEGGLPLSEIHEELDDDDNFVRGEVRRPEEATGKVLERLRMAGLSEKDLGASGAPAAKTDSVEPAAPTSPQRSSAVKLPLTNAGSASKDAPATDSQSPERPAIRKKSVSFSADTKEGETMERSNSEERKKSVSFADKVAIARAAPPPDTRSVSFSKDVEEIPAPTAASAVPQDPSVQQIPINTDPDSQSHLRGYFKPGDKVFEVNEDDETTQPHIIMPEGESEEDAAMRREMLNYHLNEVNNVVATMQLDDPDDDDDEHDDSHSEYTTSEYQDEDTPYTSGLDSDAESEDEFGRSKRPAITDAYRDEMEALKARLIGNLGKIALPDEVEGDDADAEIDPADARRLVIREKRSSIISNSSDGEKKPTAAGKKRVSFAEALDVAKPSSPPHKASKHVEGETVAPIVGGVAERTTAASHSLPTATPAAKFSRFKQARAKAVPADEEADTQSGAPTGPPGIPMADQLLERTPASVKAPDADGYDPLLARRELASEYYRRRNDMVREQGGFKVQKDEDEDMGDLMEERDDGQVKKVSRFKAARLGR